MKQKEVNNIEQKNIIEEKKYEAYCQPGEKKIYLKKEKKKDFEYKCRKWKIVKWTTLLTVGIVVVATVGIGTLYQYKKIKVADSDNLFLNDKVVVKVGDKYGLINKNGDMEYQPEYDWLVYYGKQTVFKKNGKAGLMGLKEKEIIKPQYDEILGDNEKYFPANMNENGAYYLGMVDNGGKLIIPTEYEEIGYDEESHITGAMKEGKWFYYDEQGKEISLIDEQGIEGSGEPRKGIITIRKATGEKDEVTQEPIYIYGIANTKGEVLLEPKYNQIQLFNEEEEMIPFEENGKWGYLNLEAEIVIKPQYNGIMGAGKFENGYAVVSLENEITSVFGRDFSDSQDRKAQSEEVGYGIVNKKGEYIVQPKYQNVKILDDEKFFFEKKFTWGIIDKDGKVICEYDKEDDLYDSITGEFCEGVCVISKSNDDGVQKYGLINEKGKIVVQCIYDEIGENLEVVSNNDRILVKKEGKYGYLNTKGKQVIPLEYAYGTHFFDDGYAIVFDADKKAKIIDVENKCVIDGKNGFMYYDEEVLMNEQGE